jgi:hypothetical protein
VGDSESDQLLDVAWQRAIGENGFAEGLEGIGGGGRELVTLVIQISRRLGVQLHVHDILLAR